MTLGEAVKRIRPDEIVESLWLKGMARGAMIVLVPLVGWASNTAYGILVALQKQQADEATQIQLLIHDAINDRSSVAQLFKAASDATAAVNDRANKLSDRITETQRDTQANFARISDVQHGFELRDQHLETVDHRLDALEGRGRRMDR